MTRTEPLSLDAHDGYTLAATVFWPAGPPEAAVVIAGATAAPRRVYRRLATHLAEAGFAVLTFDYRGVGDSRPDRMRGFQARARDWVDLDMAAAMAFARGQLAPDLFIFAHSIGGQLAGLLEDTTGIRGMVTVSSQSGHWRLQGGLQKWAVAVYAYVGLPGLSMAFGYMPWRMLGASDDLPKGVALEWARWCRDPDYLLGDSTLPLERFTRFDAPVLAYSVDDDDWGTPASVDAMMRAYPNVERSHIIPHELGLEALGHFGFFRPESAACWAEPIAWMRQRA